MNFDLLDPKTLTPNPWNTNRLTPEAEMKLENSLVKGIFKPIIVRELEDGTLQILGGENRNLAAQRIGITQVPVLNLGVIDDHRAKEISVIDNGRYGQDDANALAALLREIGDPVDIAGYMPFDMGEMNAMLAVQQIDLDKIGFEDDAAPSVQPNIARAIKTHVIMKVKIPVEDHAQIEATLKSVIEAQGFTDTDSAVRAGDALLWIVNNFANAS
jgi:hypothetical protein